MALTFSYLAAWIAGGIALLTILLLGTARRPYSLAFALIGYGGAGTVSVALGLPVLHALAAAGAGGAVLGGFGLLMQRLGVSSRPPRPF